MYSVGRVYGEEKNETFDLFVLIVCFLTMHVVVQMHHSWAIEILFMPKISKKANLTDAVNFFQFQGFCSCSNFSLRDRRLLWESLKQKLDALKCFHNKWWKDEPLIDKKSATPRFTDKSFILSFECS